MGALGIVGSVSNSYSFVRETEAFVLLLPLLLLSSLMFDLHSAWSEGSLALGPFFFKKNLIRLV
jgi:hypothetical protein